MRLVSIFLCAVIAAIAFAQEQSLQIKVLTYNIHNGVGLDGVRDYARVADVIAATGADIVAVQEVDSITRRSSGSYVLGEIVAKSGYIPYFAAAINFDGGKYGIGLLCRQEPMAVKRLELPGREERRVLMVAEFPQFIVANTHLSLTPADALASGPVIVDEAKSASKPFIIVGDWNSHPSSPVLAALKEAGFSLASNSNQPTFPAKNPQECIDYIAIYIPELQGVKVVSTDVINEQITSDHRPVVATFEITGQ